MSYPETIKSGFRLINARWQLVAVQAAMMLFNCLSFFIIVGIPLGIAFVIFGLDLTGLAELRDIFSLFEHPAELFSKYFGLILIVITSILFFILLVTTLGLFVFGGSVGIIGRAVMDPSSKFRLKDFFAEARRHFFPLMWYSLFAGLIFVGITFLLGIFGGGVAAIVSVAKGQDSTLALFLGIFFSLILVLIGISLMITALAVTVYGIAVLVFSGEGAMRSFRAAARFLIANPHGFWLYAILFFFYILTSFLVMLVVYPLNLIPIIGTILSLPFQIISYIIQGYIGLVITAAVFTYYYETALRETPSSEEGSIQAGDISPSQDGMQEGPLPETDRPGPA